MFDSDPNLRGEMEHNADFSFPKEESRGSGEKNYYEILGVNQGASAKEINTAYHKKLNEFTSAQSKVHKEGGSLKPATVPDDLVAARDYLLEQVDTGELDKNYTRFTVYLDNDHEQQNKSEAAWKQIEGDKHLRGVLAYCLLPEQQKHELLDKRDFLTAKDVELFYKMYPTREDFNNKADMPGLVETVNKPREYMMAANKLSRIMYPEQ